MNSGKRVSVFIDLANVEQGLNKYRKNGLRLDYSYLVKCVVGEGTLQKAIVYDSTPCGSESVEDLHRMLVNKGFDLIEKSPQNFEEDGETKHAQKEVDTSLVADVVAMACLDEYDVAVIVSGDRDMKPAGECAKNQGKEVIYAGFSHSLCSHYKYGCDNTFVIDANPVMEFVDCPADVEAFSYASSDIREEAVVDA